MDLSTSVWRSRAKVVAIVDLIFSSISLLMVFILAIAASIGTGILTDKHNIQGLSGMTKEQEKEIKSFVIFMWVVTAVSAIVTAIQLWASIRLLNSTEIGLGAHDAVRGANVYRIVSAVFLVLGVIGNVIIENYYLIPVDLLIRGIFIFIAHKYIVELQGIMASAPRGNLGKV